MRNDILKRRYITTDEVVVDWNNNDPSKGGYIENKPFGSEIVTAPNLIEWDGDITNKKVIYEEEGMGICYVSDKVINDYTELLGKQVQIYAEGNLINVTLDESMYIPPIISFAVAQINYYMFCIELNVSDEIKQYYIRFVTYSDDQDYFPLGIYFSFYHTEGNVDSYVASLNLGNEEKEIIKPLDTKFLPEHLHFGSTYTTLVENAEIYIDEQMIENPFNIELVEGTTYLVLWDNVEYKCTAYIAQGPNSPSIGNGFIANASGGNGEPFFITVYMNQVLMFSNEAGAHTIKIIIADILKIDEKYLPDTTKYQSDWNQNDVNNPNYIKNRTHYIEFNGQNIVPYLQYPSYVWNDGSQAEVNLNFILETMPPNSEDGYFHFVAGEAYTVRLNEEIYICTGIQHNGGVENMHTYLGDPDFVEYPFCLFDCNNHTSTGGLNKYFWMKPTYSNPYIGVYEGAPTVHTLPDIYLPETTKYQGNWEQNDETAVDYVKNRTHYVEKDIVLLEETELIKEPYVVGESYYIPEVGKTYHVTWDGVQYECEGKEHGSFFRYIGNLTLYKGNYQSYVNSDKPVDTGEPFILVYEGYMGVTFGYSIRSTDKAQHTIAIDECFTGQGTIPSNKYYITMPIIEGETYEVVWDGVTYDVEAKNENGRIYLGNYELGNCIDSNISEMPGTGEPFCITFDGFIACLEGEHTFSINNLISERTIRFRAISYYGGIEFEPNVEFIPGDTYKIIYDDNEYELPYNFDGTIGNYNMSYRLDPDNQVPFQLSNGYISLYPGTHKIKILRDIYHPIDIRYLSETIGRAGEGAYGEIFNNYIDNVASGSSSHAEGGSTTASGSCSHAEGNYTLASGQYSHAEGSSSEASGFAAHAEGCNTHASGTYSHAEGRNALAIGDYSHAEGLETEASGKYQHVQGRYNIEDTENKYAHIVGNGDYSSATNYKEVRSNVHTLDQSGNAWYQGDVYIGSTSGKNRDEGSKKLATEEYVVNELNNKINIPTEEEINQMLLEVGIVEV